MSYAIIIIIVLVGVGYYYYKKGKLKIPRFKHESVDEAIARYKTENDLEVNKKQELIKLRDAKLEFIKTRAENSKLRKEIDSIGVNK